MAAARLAAAGSALAATRLAGFYETVFHGDEAEGLAVVLIQSGSLAAAGPLSEPRVRGWGSTPTQGGRAAILAGLVCGVSHRKIATEVGVSSATVSNYRTPGMAGDVTPLMAAVKARITRAQKNAFKELF